MFFQRYIDPEATGVGEIGCADFINVRKPPHIVLPKVALSVAAIVAIFFLACSQEYVPVNTRTITLLTAGIVGYLTIGWFIRPEPNMKNLGMYGSSRIDDPFSYDDDKNRWLLHAKMMLAPGMFAVQSFIELGTLLGVIPERTKETIKEEWAAEAASRMPTEDHSGGSIELSSAKYFQSQPQEQEVGSSS